VFCRENGGGSPGEVFFDALPNSDKAKMLHLMSMLADNGKIFNREKFKPVEGGLFEFKSHQIRMICKFASEQGLVLITHGFQKKRDDIPPAEIIRAKRILREDAAIAASAATAVEKVHPINVRKGKRRTQ
jgi:phage-related protein